MPDVSSPSAPVVPGLPVAVRGSGEPVLVLHGSPGGIDAAGVMSRFLPSGRFRVVTVTRPGYDGTPLRHRTGLDDEADRLAAVLDGLGIDRVGVLAWSGGAPAAFRFASRYPHRVRALVVVAGVSGAWRPRRRPPLERVVADTRFGAVVSRLAARVAPGVVVRTGTADVSTLRGRALRRHVRRTMDDPARRRFLLDMAATGNAGGPSRRGWHNDVRNFAHWGGLAPGDVRVPTLLVHGDVDTEVPPEHSRRALVAIPGAELATVPHGTHFVLWDHDDAAALQARVRDFLAAARRTTVSGSGSGSGSASSSVPGDTSPETGDSVPSERPGSGSLP